jgi:ribosomal protein L11 methyltransferase
LTPSETRHWMEITIDVHPIAHESVGAFLFELGCSGVVTQNFQNHSLKAYLPAERDPEDLRRRIDLFFEALKNIFSEIDPPKVAVNQLRDQDWTQTWRQFFRPEQVTRQLRILPAWERIPPSQGGHLIRVDPGPAFGTGQHPTTRMCLEAMEKVGKPQPWSMADVGTGSGILSIYAAKLGAGQIMGFDIDADAIRWAERNIDLNGLSGRISLTLQPIQRVERSFFLVVANLTLGTILELFPHLSRLTEPGGYLVLSGLLRDQASRASAQLHKHGLQEANVLHRDEWTCVVARRRR